MMQISGEMEEAAQSLGAGWGRRMKSIVFPLTVRGMIAGFTFVFITTVRELSLIVMLVTPQTRTLTTMTMRYEELGLVQFSNAITVVLVATSLSGVWILNRIGGTRFGGGRAGGLG
jgi:iron(III) transport system permease protein